MGEKKNRGEEKSKKGKEEVKERKGRKEKKKKEKKEKGREKKKKNMRKKKKEGGKGKGRRKNKGKRSARKKKKRKKEGKIRRIIKSMYPEHTPSGTETAGGALRYQRKGLRNTVETKQTMQAVTYGRKKDLWETNDGKKKVPEGGRKIIIAAGGEYLNKKKDGRD